MREKGQERSEAEFGELSDPRVQGRVEHRLIDIIIVAVCAVIQMGKPPAVPGRHPQFDKSGKMQKLIDQIPMLIAIPPKYAVSQVSGYLKGKSAIRIARTFGGRQKDFTGEHFWARGYAVSTVRFELEQVRTYIREQEAADGTAGQF